ncbi:hypothetical protein FIU94_10755 [Sulfitobacter sp. THAF37]|uniref:hypothetical protein n=1 Tax=Sulfitobacter sp. THAF37 TaxID=2587855 RepID=UPI001268C7AD|nr:hypothetical protein [Sulfitobacter sp. THAF37]QFT59305.1 hypothetical protein FIU94_10755 [Sulfitobacter sp. THAF37]
MKPDFALSLSFEGIRLLHRAAGGWRIVGEVALDADDLNADLAVLRKSATALEPGGLRTKLLLPDEQIKYLTIDTPDMSEAERREASRAALDGATPYAVDDLAFDISQDGPRTHIAAVALETLAEAESFAVEHRFHPVSFAATPGESPYLGEPFFGETEAAATLLENGESVEADGIAVVVIGDVKVPDGPVAAAASEPAKPEKAEKQTPPAAPASDTTADAPAAPARVDPADTPERPAPGAEKPATPNEPPKPDETFAPETPASATPLPPKAEKTPTEAAKDGAADSPVSAPAASAPAASARTPQARPPEPVAKADEPSAPAKDAETVLQAPTPKAAHPEPTTGEAARASSSSSPALAEEPPEEAAEDVTVQIPTAPVAAAAAATPPVGAAPVVRTKDAPDSVSDVTSGNADRGAAATDEHKGDGAEDLPETAADTPDVPVMPPLRANRIEKKPTAAPLPPLRAEPAGFSSRRAPATPPALEGARREPKVATPAATAAALTPDDDAVMRPDSSSLDSPPPGPSIAAAPAKTGFLSRRSKAAPPPGKHIPSTPAPQPAGGAVSEAERMTIFGARKADVGGKPRFLGLILTAALLVFLAGVAAWASVFLDDGLNLSRLFGPRSTPEVAAAPDTPVPEAPATPSEDPVQTAALDSGLTEEDGAVLDALREPAPAPAQDLTEAELEAKYAATGIWPRAPVLPPEPAGEVVIEDLYLTSIDPISTAADAIALPALEDMLTDAAMDDIPNPAAAGTRFAFGPNGLVIPTAAGTVNPDGITIYLGRPELIPPDAIMARYQPQTGETGEDATEETPELDILATVRPRTRPGDLVETAERAQFDGLTLDELAEYRPALRPQSVQEQAAAAAAPPVDPADTAEAVAEALETPARPAAFENPTQFAVAASARPDPRPRNFNRIVRRAERAAPREETRVASVAPRAVAPSIPSKTSVAKQATVKNAINLRRINLIGVYGKPSNRRALIRLSNGRYQKVVVGDRIDGGRVSAIGDSELRYTKGGRSVVLTMPRS